MNKTAAKKAGRKMGFFDKYKAPAIIALLILSLSSQAQVDTSLRQQINGTGFTWKTGGFTGGFVPPKDTFRLSIRDTGAIAYKNGSYFMWHLNGGILRWDSLQAKGGSGGTGLSGLGSFMNGTLSVPNVDTSKLTLYWLPNHPAQLLTDTSTGANVKQGSGSNPDTLFLQLNTINGQSLVGTGNITISYWVANIDSVKAYKPANGTIFHTNFYSATVNDPSSGAQYQYNSASTATGDDMFTLTPTAGGTGRWILVPLNGQLNTWQLGITGSTDQATKLQAALDYLGNHGGGILYAMQDYLSNTVYFNYSYTYFNLNGHKIMLTAAAGQGRALFVFDSTFPHRVKQGVSNGFLDGQQFYLNGTFLSGSPSKDSLQNLVFVRSTDSTNFDGLTYLNAQHGMFIRGASIMSSKNFAFDGIGEDVFYDYYDSRNNGFEFAEFKQPGTWGLFYGYDPGGPGHSDPANGVYIAPRRKGADIFSFSGFNHLFHDFEVFHPGAYFHWFLAEFRFLYNVKIYNGIVHGNGLPGLGMTVGGRSDSQPFYDGDINNITYEGTNSPPLNAGDSIVWAGQPSLYYYSGDYLEYYNVNRFKMHDCPSIRNMPVEFRPFHDIKMYQNNFFVDNIKDRVSGAKYFVSLGGMEGAGPTDTSSNADIFNNTYNNIGDAIIYKTNKKEVISHVRFYNETWNAAGNHMGNSIGEFFAPNSGRVHDDISFENCTFTGDQSVYRMFFVYPPTPSKNNFFFRNIHLEKTNVDRAHFVEDFGTPHKWYQDKIYYGDGNIDNAGVISANSGALLPNANGDLDLSSLGGSGTPGNPTAKSGYLPINGTATTYMRSDAAPPIDTVAIDARYQRLFNVVRFGADSTGVIDATPAIQSAVNAAHAAGGGVVFFPSGTYKIAGALQTSISGTNPNSQIYIPSVSISSSSRRGAIIFRGEVTNNVPSGYSPSLVAPLATTGAIIKSTLSSASGNKPAIFGTIGTTGNYQSLNYTDIEFENLTIEAYTNHGTAAPVLTAINLYYAAKASFRKVNIGLDTTLQASHTAATAGVSGLILGQVNNDGPNNLNELWINGYTYGYWPSEHTSINQMYLIGNQYAMAVPAGNYTIDGKVTIHACPHGIYSPNSTVLGFTPGNAYINLTIESEMDSTGGFASLWYKSLDNVTDSGNHLFGNIRIQNVSGDGLGTNLSRQYTVVGGAYVRMIPYDGFAPGNMDIQSISDNLNITSENIYYDKSVPAWKYRKYGPGSSISRSFGQTYFATFPTGNAGATAGSISNNLFIDTTGRIGVNEISPPASAQLTVTSTTKGFLPPRMNTTQMNAISSPATGLIVWNSDTLALFKYTGIAWVKAEGSGAGGGSGITGLTTGRVPFAASSTTIADDAGLTWDNTNKMLNVTYSAASYPGLTITNTNGGGGSSITLTDGTLHTYLRQYGTSVGIGLGGNAAFGGDQGFVHYTDGTVANGGTHGIEFRTGGYDVTQKKMYIGSDKLYLFNTPSGSGTPKILAIGNDSGVYQIPYPTGTTYTGGNGIGIVSNAINWGGTLNATTSILGAGNPLQLGTSGSNLSTFQVNTSGAITLSAGTNITLLGSVAYVSSLQLAAPSGSTTFGNTYSNVDVTNPSLVASATWTLPASPPNGMDLYINMIGSGTNGAASITSLTINPNSGQTLMGPTVTTANYGDFFWFHYSATTTTWIRRH